MAQEITIIAQQRDTSPEGRRTGRALRREGIVPGVMYGANFETVALQFPARELTRIYRRAGTSSIVTVQVDGEKEPLRAFFRDVQRDPVNGAFLHVDLYHIVAGQAIRNAVPVMATGHAPVTELGAIVAQIVESIEIECLPKDMPAYLVADLSSLDSHGSHLAAGQLVLPAGVTLVSDPELEIFQVNMPRMALEEETAEMEGGIEYGAAEEMEEGEDEDSEEA